LNGITVERLRAVIPTLDLPSFVYDPAIVTANVRSVRDAFPGYHYPVKCNAHPALMRAAVAAGAELDLCSDGDLDAAEEISALTPRSSYTGAGLTPKLFARIAAARCRANLDSLHEVALWARLFPGRAFGVRLQTGYDVKFGLTPPEVEKARAMAGNLVGIHVHDSHRGRTADQAMAVLAAALQTLDATLIRDLEYVSLGGGWPHAYEGETEWNVREVAAAFDARPMRELQERGFHGQVLIEPGEFIVARAGAWIARVATVKTDRDSGPLVILDTPTPIPCADYAYPMTLMRGMEVVGYGDVMCTIHGSTNSGRDRIRRGVLLPDPLPGDVVTIHDTGAYVQALISRFNERRPPSTYVLPPA